MGTAMHVQQKITATLSQPTTTRGASGKGASPGAVPPPTARAASTRGAVRTSTANDRPTAR